MTINYFDRVQNGFGEQHVAEILYFEKPMLHRGSL